MLQTALFGFWLLWILLKVLACGLLQQKGKADLSVQCFTYR